MVRSEQSMLLNIKELASHIASFPDSLSDSVHSPYIIHLKKKGKKLILIGTRHTKNPEDPHITLLKEMLPDILNNGLFNICIEWTTSELNDLSEVEQIKQYGEVAVFINFARKNHINIRTIEPTFDQISQWALELLPSERTFAQWALLNVLSVMIPGDGVLPSTKKDNLHNIIASIGARYNIQGTPNDIYLSILEDMQQDDIRILPNTFDKLFDVKINTNDIIDAQQPKENAFATNHAAIVMNKARDFGLLKNTLDVANEPGQDTTLVWQGLNHVIAQIPAYEALGFMKAD